MRTGRWNRLVAGAVVAAALASPAAARRANDDVRIDEVLAGANGDSSVQFIELTVPAFRRAFWGPRPGDPDHPEPRARLTFHDATGAQTGEFPFPDDPRVGVTGSFRPGYSVLVATAAFERETGLAADFVMPPLVPAVDGMVCFRDNPANTLAEPVNLCLSYGNYQGPEERDACGNPNGPPGPALPIAAPTPRSLRRFQNDGRGEQFGCADLGPHNADFALDDPSPSNAWGAWTTFAALPLAEQGETLFSRETFAGNGRTCLACHGPEDRFGLTPETIARRFSEDPQDPLFVGENDPALAELENSCLLRMGDERGLILENPGGFDRPPAFRNSPHLLNIEGTAPYGLSGGFGDLRSFCANAVVQHFPKTLARNADPAAGPLDLRMPTPFELEAMEAFMNSIRFPADGDVDLDRMIDHAVANGADAAAIQRGRDLFFGETGRAQCFRCHSGPLLSEADGSLGTGAGPQQFDIGVGFRSVNFDDGCEGGPGDPTLPLPEDFRSFSTPPLVGVANTAPFFHDNSAPDLHTAVNHYTMSEFRFSQAGFLMEFFRIRLTDPEIDDIVAFLEAISVDPSAPPPERRDVEIDVRPFSRFNFVVLTSHQALPVGVLGSDSVDVNGIDAGTLAFGPGGARAVSHQVRDTNRDGHLDLVARFPVQETGLAAGDTSACLVGEIDGAPFRACDPVYVMLFACGLGFEVAFLVPPLLWLRGRRRRSGRGGT